MIYSFGIWRDELDRLSAALREAMRTDEELSNIEPSQGNHLPEISLIRLREENNQQLLKGFLLTSLIMRKMDDAAKRPLPAGQMKGLQFDRELKNKKRLSEYNFSSFTAREELEETTTKTTMKDFGSLCYNGREVTNLAVHSEEMRMFAPPDEDPGFWIRSDKKPCEGDPSVYWFLDLNDYLAMLDGFRHDPWKDLENAS